MIKAVGVSRVLFMTLKASIVAIKVEESRYQSEGVL